MTSSLLSAFGSSGFRLGMSGLYPLPLFFFVTLHCATIFMTVGRVTASVFASLYRKTSFDSVDELPWSACSSGLLRCLGRPGSLPTLGG